MSDLAIQARTESASCSRAVSGARKDVFRFLDLPAEVRQLIYYHVFSESKLNVWFGDLSEETRHYDSDFGDDSEEDGDAFITHPRELPTQILETCRTIYREAAHLLPLCTRLYVEVHPEDGPSEPVYLRLPAKMRRKITEIEHKYSPPVPLQLWSFTNLKRITLEHQVYCALPGESTNRRAIEDLTMKMIRLYDSELMKDGVLDIVDGDGVEVRMRVWFVHYSWTSYIGWDIEVDARNWKCLDVQRTRFECDEQGQWYPEYRFINGKRVKIISPSRKELRRDVKEAAEDGARRQMVMVAARKALEQATIEPEEKGREGLIPT